MNDLRKKNFTELIFDLIKDPDRKPVYKMIHEIIVLAFLHRKFPGQYFSQYLYKKDIKNIKDYFYEDFFFYKIKPFLNEHGARDVIENKLYFSFFYSQFNIPQPEILMYNHRKMFVFGKDCFEINNTSDFKEQLKRLFEMHYGIDSIFIKRTYGSYGGKQVFKLTKDQLTGNGVFLENLYSEVITTGFLFQKTVSQHPELNKISSSSLNTIRIDTFIDKDGKAEIMSAYLRMSTNNKHVDNISSGGCQVGIWLDSGKMKKVGYSNIRTVGTKVYTEHPITGVIFEGFQIPYFNEVKELVIKTAELMPGLRLVGWDVAVSETGPVLIEGNSDYAVSGNDMADGGYRKNPVFRKVLKELNYL